MRTLVASAAGAVMAGLMLAACGSSGGSSTPQTSPPEATASPAANAPEGGAATVSLKSVSGVDDKALVGPDGKTVYLFEGDENGKPTCSGACAGLWPPVTASGMPSAGSGLDQSKLGTVKRSDGGTQVTYAGHPLYYYSGDTGPGTAMGQGLKAFGSEWYVLGATGDKLGDES